MATMKIFSSPIGRQLNTILSRKIGRCSIVRDEQMTGPFGGTGWRKYLLSDGRWVIIGEKMGSRRNIPKWIKNQFGELVAAGSGNGWRAYVTKNPSGVINGCICQICGNLYTDDFIVCNEVWEEIKPNGKPVGGGLMCGSCMLNRIKPGTYRIVKI
jgi:hypothetical protein